MKYISKKVIRGKAYYYLQYRGYAKNLGEFLPTDLRSQLFSFLCEAGKKESEKLDQKIKNQFKYGNIERLEALRFIPTLLKHDLFKTFHEEFYNKLAILFTYHSNRSEGSKTSKKAIETFVASNIKKPTTKTELEILNSLLAFDYILSKDMKWSTKSIKHIHKLLLNGIDPMIAGKWKNENNTVSNQKTTDYKEVSEKMKELILWLKTSFKKEVYPPELALSFYCRFEKIHPFLDGNGRVGRLLLNAILYKFNYPPVIFFSDNHLEHCTGIQQALEGRWNKINKHFLKQVEKTIDIMTPLIEKMK